MKIKINTEINGKEVIDELMVPQLKGQGITPADGEIKVQVFSEKGGKFIDFKPENVKIIFARE